MTSKLKILPLTIMLIAGAASSVITWVLRYESVTALWINVGVLILFYIIGCIVQKILLKFEKEIAEEEARKAEEEGKVVEKEGTEGDGSEEDGENAEPQQEN